MTVFTCSALSLSQAEACLLPAACRLRGRPALSERISRRQGLVASIHINYPLNVEDNTDIQACITILQAQEVSISLRVYGSAKKENKEEKKRKQNVLWEVDEEGWAALAQAMHAKPDAVQGVEASKDWLAHLSRREDTEAIWEAVGDQFIVHQSEDGYMWDERWAQRIILDKAGTWLSPTWAMLEEVLDMPSKEFEALIDPESEEYLYY